MPSDKPDPRRAKPPSSSSSSSSSSSKSASKSTSKPKSAGELRQDEWDAFVKDSMKSHAGWLAQPILSLSSQLSYSPVHVALALSIPILLMLLVSPAGWVPHLCAPFVLLIPVQNTLHSMAVETKKGRSDAQDAQQWALYWCVWCVLGLVGGWVETFRPGWKGLWQVGRVVALVIAGGPWFSRASLRSDGPGPELQAAEKKEAAESDKADKEAAKRKEKEEKAKQEKAAKDAKEKEKAKAKAKAK